MKINYYPETDSLYLELSDKSSVDSQEIADEVVVDFDINGNIVGIDLDKAAHKLDLNTVEAVNLPQLLTTKSN
ncbi:MAG: DUF2283 domain-containing protein [Oscillatoria sp. PMC 1068.18]|nr:DUF2283 domain-containing protein [Oscillatoria sp. PMC 1076.18]MEC4988883.1 DUF2283 domain-containing protein [Oscillatoria sp. PMC 1068.18]